jgi:hypothetical protein
MLHYDRCAKYYGSTSGQGMYGASSDEEKRLTMMLFSNIFDSLSKMVSYSLQSRVNSTLIYNWYLIYFIIIKCCKGVTSDIPIIKIMNNFFI